MKGRLNPRLFFFMDVNKRETEIKRRAKEKQSTEDKGEKAR